MNKKLKTSYLTAIDLFAGAGGLSLAARNLKIHVLAAVELNNHACDTYRRNFIQGKKKNVPRLYEQDILSLQPEDMLSDLGIGSGNLDILMGGPPCQGYSTHRIKDAGVDDPRNKLLLRYFDFVKALKPKVFVVENVPGLLWPRHTEYLKQFRAEAKKAKYTLLDPQILNARDYGVPQTRKRVFFLGFRKDIQPSVDWPPPETHGAPESEDVQHKKKKPWKTAQSVFEEPLPPDDPNSVHMQHTKELIEAFKRTPINGGSRKDSGRVLPCHENHNGHKDVYGRIDPSKPGPTMTTACVNPSKGRFVHPTQNHGITVRHAARLQDFPDNFIFEGGLMAAGIQVGNAVPIGLGLQVISTAITSIMIR